MSETAFKQTTFKQVNGYQWPADDTDCMAVTFNDVADLERAIKYCRAKDFAVQAGGNAGVWPIYLAKQFKQVLTFEPHPVTFECLKRNCAKFENIIIEWAALGSGEGHADITLPQGPRNMGATRILPHMEGLIEVTSLDSCKIPKVDLIQLDIEGYEPLALLGATETIQRDHPVLMIEEKGLSEFYGYEQGWIHGWLWKLGYRVAETIHRDKIYVWGEAVC